jgi:DNA-binding transcriptional ArsR family regulator
VYSSRITKRVAPSSGVSVNVRTPLNRPSGMPPLQVMRSAGENSVTLTGNARPGLASETTLIFSRGAIRPSTRTTPESQSGYDAASVRIPQTTSGRASISEVASYCLIRKVQVTITGVNPFEALGDPNRRAIVELLRGGDRSVQQLADELPISRPAVSRHLRLLKEAGLVADRPQGTRRLYRLHDEGIEAVREYLEQVWGDAAARFRIAAENTERR